jgi:radical SAM protein with 4Fe4S-binding SPASM domain
VTNASLLTEDLARQLIASGLDRMKVSFYGVDKEEYESVHRNLKYEEVRENVRRLARLKKEMRRRTPIIETKYIGRWRRYPKFCLQWVAHTGVAFHRLHNYGTGRRFVRVDARSRRRACPMVMQPIMQIQWTGEVVPCCYDFNGEMVLGDVTRRSLAAVWNGEAYREFRGIHERKEFEKLPYCMCCDKLR